MTQDEATKYYNNYKQVVEQQRREEIELAKSQCELLIEKYQNRYNEERDPSEKVRYADQMKQAENSRDNKISDIEKETAARLAAAEERLKENVEQAKQMEAKLMEDKARQDAELRQKELSNEEHQKQRAELDKAQEIARQEMIKEQAAADALLKENLQKDLREQQREIEKQRQELERQRELERERQMQNQNRDL